MSDVYNCLVIYGGGARGLATAYVLRRLEKHIYKKFGVSLTHFFSGFAGTSSGSVLSSALAVGYDSDQIIELSKHWLPHIFTVEQSKTPKSILKSRLPPGILGPKYNSSRTIEALKVIFNNKEILKDKDLFFSSYDFLNAKPVIFRKQRNALSDIRNVWYAGLHAVPLWHSIACSTAAPFLFSPQRLNIGNRILMCIDGGLCGNNPVLLPYLELLSRGIEHKNMRFIVIGSGKAKILKDRLSQKPKAMDNVLHWNMWQWVKQGPLFEILFGGQSDMCNHLMGGILSEHQYLYLNFELENVDNNIFNASPRNLKAMENLINIHYKSQIDKKIEDFFKLPYL